jgi:hypothetical protein
MPSSFLSRTSSPMRISRFALFTWYGISSTMIAWRSPLPMSSTCVRADHDAAASVGSLRGRPRCRR